MLLLCFVICLTRTIAVTRSLKIHSLTVIVDSFCLPSSVFVFRGDHKSRHDTLSQDMTRCCLCLSTKLSASEIKKRNKPKHSEWQKKEICQESEQWGSPPILPTPILLLVFAPTLTLPSLCSPSSSFSPTISPRLHPHLSAPVTPLPPLFVYSGTDGVESEGREGEGFCWCGLNTLSLHRGEGRHTFMSHVSLCVQVPHIVLRWDI